MEQQTAVEWLKLKTKQIDFFVETKQITWKEYHKTKDNLYEQAKEMHKEELGNAYEQGWKDASIEAMKEMHKYQ
jgi:hypothetical protein